MVDGPMTSDAIGSNWDAFYAVCLKSIHLEPIIVWCLSNSLFPMLLIGTRGGGMWSAELEMWGWPVLSCQCQIVRYEAMLFSTHFSINKYKIVLNRRNGSCRVQAAAPVLDSLRWYAIIHSKSLALCCCRQSSMKRWCSVPKGLKIHPQDN